MGYIKHHAIVVTCWDSDRIARAIDQAKGIGLAVVGPSPETVNGYSSFLICPDGSKEGWETSDTGDDRRKQFKKWLDDQWAQDQFYEWVEVAYGNDDGHATVETHAWEGKEDE